MGRWSELSVVSVVHSKSVAISGVVMERSGEVAAPCEGSLVGVSELRMTRPAGISESRISSPRAAARVSLVCENHAGLWALKSPRMRVSSRGERRSSREGEKSGGHEEVGGMYMLKILSGVSLMMAVMARCSVMLSLGKRGSVLMGEYWME